MRLYTIEENGIQTVAAEVAGDMYMLSDLGVNVASMNVLILNWDSIEEKLKAGINKVGAEAGINNRENACAVNTEDSVRENLCAIKPANDYKILAPVIRPLQDIICLGVNYKDHINETKAVIDFTKKADTVYFSKRVNRCTEPGGVIPCYDFTDKLDYEVELGVILKKDAFRVSPEAAGDYILGYTIINDVSARDIQLKHQQWYLGKSLDGYTPMGPCIVTADEIGDVHDLDIKCYVNGEKRQESNTGYMLTTIEEAIAELSQGMTLAAGTVIATGTPGGVAMSMNPPVFLKPGDTVRCEIEDIGVLENKVM